MMGLLSFVFFCYVILILYLAIGFEKITFFTKKEKTPKTSFSVIIPFRNEEKKLPHLLTSINELAYPKELVEFLFVDDDSSDNSVQLIKTSKNYQLIKNLRKSNSPKKDAIETAVNLAKNTWILTTDADCILPKKWLQVFDDYIQTHAPKMIVAPVNYKVTTTFLDQFQKFDFLSLQASTMGGFGIHRPFLCNGANLGYLKETFFNVKGFDGNNGIASGDDIFLFEKFVLDTPNDVHFIKSKEAIVTTFPVATFPELIQQRTRWAAKSSHYRLQFTRLVGALVFSMNFLLVLSVFFTFFHLPYLPYIGLLFILKLFIDWILLRKSIRFFNQKANIVYYIVSSLCYPFFSAFIFLNTLFSNYKWKERSFKK